ncbi:hypothetical protein Tsubulata_032297 [Turnera subulata]|uniref:DUF4283 domain-containing protein n=1 Tax=Turnera subulata TaxID=218843 RepID=A0A9Q0J1L9_9ROSI|nr:hypothetical protein Tsubulata_032297 [Turnera subulata]
MRVLTGGPWMIFGAYLSVERWRPNFHPSTHRVSSVVAWVRIPGLPTEHYHIGVLKMVCDMIGRTVRIDMPTQQTDRAQFARIAVELDLTKALESRVCIEDTWYHIEYEDLPQVCFVCGMAGHNLSASDVRTPPEVAASDATIPQSVQGKPIEKMRGPQSYGDVVNEPKYGHWMLVTRKKAPPKKTNTSVEDRRQAPQVTGGFRFNVLASTMEDEVNFSAGREAVNAPRGVKATVSSNPGSSSAARRSKGKAIATVPTAIGPNSKRPRQNEASFSPVIHNPFQTSPVTPTTKDAHGVKVLLKQHGDNSSPVPPKGRTPITKVPTNEHAVPSPNPVLTPTPVVSKNTTTHVSPTKAGLDAGLEIAFDSSRSGHDVLKDTFVSGNGGMPILPSDQPQTGGVIQMDASLATDGAGSDKFARAVRDLVRNHRPTILALLETKVPFAQVQPILVQSGFDGFEVAEVEGRTGGIWLCWQSTRLAVTSLRIHKQFVHTTISWHSGLSCQVTAVYASPEEKLGYNGSPFMWEHGGVQERLDRALANTDWRLTFPDADVFHLPGTKSDHSPVLVRL